MRRRDAPLIADAARMQLPAPEFPFENAREMFGLAVNYDFHIHFVILIFVPSFTGWKDEDNNHQDKMPE